MATYLPGPAIPPRKDGGPWLSTVIDEATGDLWPTGSCHPSCEHALVHGARTAEAWSVWETQRPYLLGGVALVVAGTAALIWALLA